MNRQNVARVIMFEIKKDQKIRKKEFRVPMSSLRTRTYGRVFPGYRLQYYSIFALSSGLVFLAVIYLCAWLLRHYSWFLGSSNKKGLT